MDDPRIPPPDDAAPEADDPDARLARALRRICDPAPPLDDRAAAARVHRFLERAALWSTPGDEARWPWVEPPAERSARLDRAVDALRARRPELGRTWLTQWACERFLAFAALSPPPSLPNPYEPLVEVVAAGVWLARSHAGGIDVGLAFVPLRGLEAWRASRAQGA